MKAQLIRAEQLTNDQQHQVMKWLKSNGCPYMVPFDSHIQVTGNHVTLETFTIKRTPQALTLWPTRLPENWEPPTKVRKYRIRHELRLT